MRTALVGAFLLGLAVAMPASAGESEVRAAQGTIEQQLRAFQSGDGARAYSFAAPNIQRIFPTADVFMGMVERGYQPVFKPQSFSFGATQELSPSSIAQSVTITGPDGKEYEALYQLELQPDGNFRITGVSLRAAQTLGA